MDYIGVVNVGSKRKSDLDRFRQHDKTISETTRKAIEEESSLNFCHDYSMSTERLNGIINANILE